MTRTLASTTLAALGATCLLVSGCDKGSSGGEKQPSKPKEKASGSEKPSQKAGSQKKGSEPKPSSPKAAKPDQQESSETDEPSGESGEGTGDSKPTAGKGSPTTGGDQEPPPEPEGGGYKPDKQALEFGKTVSDVISSPEAVDTPGIEFETDWYKFDAQKGDKITVRVTPKEGSKLRPYLVVMKPRGETREWREIGGSRASKTGEEVEVTFTADTSGEHVVTLDDSRNMPTKEMSRPESFLGGKSFTYEIVAEKKSGGSGESGGTSDDSKKAGDKGSGTE